jgi:uncharacterized membrane protein YcaP (DUF421 family)
VLTIFFWSVTLDALSYRWPRFARIVKARPKLLVQDCQINRRARRRDFMNNEKLWRLMKIRCFTEGYFLAPN